MQFTWLKQTEAAPRVIVVFGGWAIGPDVIWHLAGEEDVLFVSDYRSLEQSLPDLGGYQHRSLVAWSFGVSAYAHWQAHQRVVQSAPGVPIFHRKIALCGSMTPVDRRLGIAPLVMEKTIEGLSEATFQLFCARCFNQTMPHRSLDVAARRAELIAVRERGPAPFVDWHRIGIALDDRIFPAASLERSFASQQAAIRKLAAPHVPFALWSSWAQVLE